MMSVLQSQNNMLGQVRAAAYAALAAQSLELLDRMEVLRPLCDTSALLLAETDPTARPACEALVRKAIAHEHANRRRWVSRLVFILLE